VRTRRTTCRKKKRGTRREWAGSIRYFSTARRVREEGRKVFVPTATPANAQPEEKKSQGGGRRVFVTQGQQTAECTDVAGRGVCAEQPLENCTRNTMEEGGGTKRDRARSGADQKYTLFSDKRTACGRAKRPRTSQTGRTKTNAKKGNWLPPKRAPPSVRHAEEPGPREKEPIVASCKLRNIRGNSVLGADSKRGRGTCRKGKGDRKTPLIKNKTFRDA